MSRIRSIHPGIWTDETFVGLSSYARLLFIGIWNESDDKGTFQWSPLQMKMRVLPADNVDAAELLEELLSADCIARYEIAGRKYGAVRNFCKFQRPKKPNDIHPISAEMLAFVAFSAERAPDDAQPVTDQLPTGGEKPPQMEDGEKEEGEVSPPIPQGDEEDDETSFAVKVVEAWNAGPASKGATKALKLDSSRRKQLATRAKEHGEPAVLDAIRGIAASPHHCGKNDRNWRASLSWILESPGNFMKALEMAPADTGIPASDKTPEERIAQAQQMIGFNQRLGRESEVEEWTRKLIAAGGKPEPPGNVAYIGQREQDQLKRMITQ